MKYLVEVIYQTVKGNEGIKRATIEAESHSAALKQVEEKVRNYKRCLKLVGGNCVEAVPIITQK